MILLVSLLLLIVFVGGIPIGLYIKKHQPVPYNPHPNPPEPTPTPGLGGGGEESEEAKRLGRIREDERRTLEIYEELGTTMDSLRKE